MKITSIFGRPFIGISLLLLSLFLFSACASGPATPSPDLGDDGTTPTAVSTPDGPAVEPTTSSTVQLGEQPCPSPVNNVTYWSTLVPLETGSAIGRVACAHMKGDNSLQAAVLIGHEGTGHLIDVYVYDQIETGPPTQIFKVEGLYKGDMKISPYSTLITAEADTNSRINRDQPNALIQWDLFREFKWSASENTLVPVAFPGIYPDLTRWQAETDQEHVNGGTDPWKLDASEVAKHFGADLLDWAGATATITNGGGASDLGALVALKSPHPGNPVINVHLSRLEGKATNLWVVTSVDSQDTTITSPTDRSTLTSPVDVTGKGVAFEGVVGDIVIYDHLYDKISTTHTTETGSVGNGPTTYSAHVSYTTTFTNATQEGIVAHYTDSAADGSIATVAMVKVLLKS